VAEFPCVERRPRRQPPTAFRACWIRTLSRSGRSSSAQTQRTTGAVLENPRARVPQQILAPLLLDDLVAGGLAGEKLTTVLDQSVELAEEPAVLPTVIAPTQQTTLLVVDLQLEDRCGEIGKVHHHPAAGFADAFTEPVGELHDPLNRSTARCAGDPRRRLSQPFLGGESQAQCGIGGYGRLLERQHPSQIGDGPGRIGNRDPVDDAGLIGIDRRDVNHQLRRLAAPSRRLPGQLNDPEMC
jgi:hypothetical protein